MEQLFNNRRFGILELAKPAKTGLSGLLQLRFKDTLSSTSVRFLSYAIFVALKTLFTDYRNSKANNELFNDRKK